MEIKQSNRNHLIVFSVFTGILLFLLAYSGSTGWQFFNSNDNKQEWNSSGPGYHK